MTYALLLALIAAPACFIGKNPHEKRGDAYFREERYDDAYAEYTIALRQEGNDADIRRKMGKTSVLRRDLKGAREAYGSLLELSPADSVEAAIDFFRLGVAFYEEGDILQMAASFESLFEIDSTYNIGEYFYHLGDYYYDNADFERAIRQYTRALGYRPEDPMAAEATFRLAQSNEKVENYRDALLYYEQFIRGSSSGEDVTTAQWHRGLCALKVAREEFEEGDLAGALEYARVPISTGQPPVQMDDAWFLTGEIYREMEKPDSALVAYQKVLELNPSRTGRLVSLSLQRIQEIKFGR